MKKPEIIVALDVDTLEEVRNLVDVLGDRVNIYKIGSQIFTACGPAAARFVMARGKQVFLDLKFHDIPNTVASAVRSAVGLVQAVERNAPMSKENASSLGGLLMLTVHTSGGEDMMWAAAESAKQAAADFGVSRPLVVGVTVLTSQPGLPAEGLTCGKHGDKIMLHVLERAALARDAGLDGVVASCHEAAAIRREFGQDFVIVTPGIRPAGSDAGDQKRVATPKAAVDSGSNYLVIGRPIVKAADPRQAVADIFKDMRV